MPLKYDPTTSKITLNDQEVGEYFYSEGIARVRLNLTYECGSDEWVVPLSYFDYGLDQLTQYKAHNEIAVRITSGEDAIAERYNVVRLLTEKSVKRDGYVWSFHNSDADNWPSAIHGHDYDKHLKLDVLTGKIYDAGTRQLCKKLTTAGLKAIQDELRGSKDFRDRVVALIDMPNSKDG
jgi:hypothetical protein